MSNLARNVNEAALRTDLNELVHTLASELAMSCKKISIYSANHPVGRKALEKPFLLLTRLFQFRHYVVIGLQRASLHICNISLKDAVYHAQVIQPMQINDINVVLFEHRLSTSDFGIFMERFVRRVRPEDPSYHINNYLAQRGITTAEVNSERAYAIVDAQRHYRGDVEDDFSIRRCALDQIGNDPLTLATLCELDDSSLLSHGIDFMPPIVRYLLPERVASLPHSDFRRELERLHGLIAGQPQGTRQREEDIRKYISLIKLVELHPERDRIIKHLETFPDAPVKPQSETVTDPKSTTGAIKISALGNIEALLDELFTPANQDYDITAFSDAFDRLLKTGLRAKAGEVVNRLIDYLSDSNPSCRQKALNLLLSSIDRLQLPLDAPLFEAVTKRVVAQLASRRETYEYSELIWRLCDRCLVDRRYDLIAELTNNMATRRLFDRDVTIYDSMAVKKAFETLNRSEVIDRLVKELIIADYETGNQLKRIMVGLGSEEVAFALSQIVAHPIRHVRQQALRILADLGKASLKVFSRIVMDDSWFEREKDRQELADNKWYLVRNSIFVLGSLKDPEAIAPLRLRISDGDIRVRREIVSALEKIGGEEAIDLLMIMAEDNSHEIREGAIAAIGVLGSYEIAPLLIDLVSRNSAESTRIISVLGKLGGQETLDFLTRLLQDEEHLTNLAGGKASKDDLRLAVVKALGSIGDQTAIQKIKDYQSSLSVTQKVLFKNSPVNKAITDILSKK